MKEIIKEFLKIIRDGKRKDKWRKLHPESDTIPMNDFDFNHVHIGHGSYGELNVVDFGGENELIIKNYVSIAQHVTFVINAEHYVNHISTYPFKVKELHTQDSESFGKGDIVVCDDVWIGYGATIMSGVTIGQGAIIAAGALVTKDVEPYSIVGGVPAKHIKFRFDSDMVEKLKTISYDSWDVSFIQEHLQELYQEPKSLKDLEWLK